MRIAVDIGGTFTDLVALEDQGNLHRSKSLTTPEELASIRSRFNALYQEHYGHSAPEEPVVIVNLRLTAIGAAANRLSLRASFQKDDKGKKGLRQVTFDGAQGPVLCPIFLRSGLSAGERLQGPAVVEEIGSTILIYPGDAASVNQLGHLSIEIGR